MSYPHPSGTVKTGSLKERDDQERRGGGYSKPRHAGLTCYIIELREIGIKKETRLEVVFTLNSVFQMTQLLIKSVLKFIDVFSIYNIVI